MAMGTQKKTYKAKKDPATNCKPELVKKKHGIRRPGGYLTAGAAELTRE